VDGNGCEQGIHKDKVQKTRKENLEPYEKEHTSCNHDCNHECNQDGNGNNHNDTLIDNVKNNYNSDDKNKGKNNIVLLNHKDKDIN
jgi:hypothetical protein